MRRFAPLAPLALLATLAACGTPQEQCIRAATKDMRIVERLIAEAEGNIERGYAYETIETFSVEKQACGQVVVDGQPQTVYCDIVVPESRRVPKAIDLAVEQAKLDSLTAKLAEQKRDAVRAIKECRILYPEEES